jgi:hypothetical protein
MPRGERALEVFTTRSGSLFLDFGAVEGVRIMEKLADVGVKIPTGGNIFKTVARPVSNFEYLVMVGTMAGRSFHAGEPFEFPLAGEVVGIEKVGLPTADFRMVYENRRILETEDVEGFAAKIYTGIVVPRLVRPQVDSLHGYTQRDLLVSEGIDVKRAAFLGKDMVCLALSSAILQFVRISDKPQLIGFQQPSIAGEFVVVGDRVMIVGPPKSIQFIDPKTVGSVVEMPMPVEFPTALGESIFFMGNECVVYSCPRNDPTSVQELFVAPERICGLEMSETFNVIAVMTIDNVLRLCTLTNGEVTTIVNLDGEPDRVLITPGWGFIVVASGPDLAVYAINGDRVGGRKLEADVRAWSAFADHRLLDFLICVDTEYRINEFEVGRPESDAVIANGRRMDFIAVRWIEDRSCIAAITGDGVLALYPISIE